MDPVACRPIIKCRKTGCPGSCPLAAVQHGVHSWDGDSHVQDLRDDFPALKRHSVRCRQLSKCLSCHVSTFQLGFLA